VVGGVIRGQVPTGATVAVGTIGVTGVTEGTTSVGGSLGSI